MLSVLCFSLLSVFQAWWAIPAIILSYLARGLNGPLLLGYVNQLIPSDVRATVLSVKSMVSRLLFSIIGPLIGGIADGWSLSTALGSAAVLYFVLGVIALGFLHKYKAL